MRARLVIFPIRGRSWCFTKSIDKVAQDSGFNPSSLTLKDLWKRITKNEEGVQGKAEIVTEFFSEKMNRAWLALGEAPDGSFKHKIHGMGQLLLARVQPSEFFLKSISKDITEVEVTFPASLNPRLVRRRLRHVAMRGSIYHRRFFYGSMSLLPFTTALAVLPLPNIPFFWILFRAYSHWRACQGSERLLLLASDCSTSWGLLRTNKGNHMKDNSSHIPLDAPCPWVLRSSEKLQRLLKKNGEEIRENKVAAICEAYNLNKMDVLKFRDFKK
ncbi:hypothetical protein AMTRI_Chr12g267070 [Amborella trichopoda]|uniref:uncharacterized protein LOC18427474 n=1 Tax=Amborella trichopoda TaxID=13333 RepID=UPI0005D4595A|nr:uncharacterized protein LOC18427474 [Amborella trichopoda]|eukprot:XP_011620865.1 uncharacterized protein LOC18427474 [Amborella trichopoda]